MATTGYALSDSSTTNLTATTFTPTVTLVGGAGNTTQVYSINTGITFKLGKSRYCEIELSGDGGAEGAGTGQVNIALPEAAASDSVAVRALVGNYVNGATVDIVFGTIAASGTTIAMGKGTAAITLQGNDQNNTTRSILIKFWYRTAV